MLSRFSVVLVAPQGERNVGSICRVMQNFSVDDLRIVSPSCNYMGEESRKMAVRSAALLDEAVIHTSLHDAVCDCQLVIGTTRRFGKYRDEFIYPEDIAAKASSVKGRVALVFGREDHGLSTDELALCHSFLTIPTSEKLPSMNIAQAVAVSLYTLYNASFGEEHNKKSRDLAVAADLELMFEHMKQSLDSIGYLNEQNPDHIIRAYRKIFGRAGLTDREVRILQGLWSKIDWLLTQSKMA